MTQKHLLHVFPTFAVGGSQMRFAQLARLHGDRYRHTVISLDSFLRFRAALRALHPDVLFTYNWGAIEWALINRLDGVARDIHVEDGFGPEETKTQLTRRAWQRRLAVDGRNTMVLLPPRNLERIARPIGKLPPARVRYIPNGIDCA